MNKPRLNYPAFTAKHNEAVALIEQMSLTELASFTSGRNFWHVQGSERLGLAPVMITDGPHGLRKQRADGDHVGLNESVPATCFPTASALASSWDRDLVRDVGQALGRECVAEGVAVLLGPGMNLKRHPLCGRNFEYFSEDPLLSGTMAAAMVQGIQVTGVGACLKHFAVNNQEHGRMYVDVVVDERTLRELYLKGFEIAVKTAQPWTVMCAYNRLGGVYCSEHDWLLNRVLRREWGFAGLVMTDWGAASDRPSGVAAGLDLEMPGSRGINDARVEAAVKRGKLSHDALKRSAARCVSLNLWGSELPGRNVIPDMQAHHTLARSAAEQSAVLLKNEGGHLPLRQDEAVGVIGAFARSPRYQGTGSSQVNPWCLEDAWSAFVAALGEDRVRYAPGYEPERSDVDEALLDEAATLAADVEQVVVFAGLPVTYESEGFDRTHMRMPEQHNRLIERVAAVNPNIIVVLCNGAPVEMPWIDAVPAVLEAYLGGQAGGSAVVNLLLGRANPCGKLAETFPLRQEDVPADAFFPGSGRQVQYREGLYVGYRYFDSASRDVLFPFGHGLSYTEFDYLSVQVSQTDEVCHVDVQLKNSGRVSGAEVVQVYLHACASARYRPEQTLAGFAKVYLEPGEQQQVRIDIEQHTFAVWEEGRWMVEQGEYEVRVGASSRDIRLRDTMVVAGESLAPMGPPGPAIGDGPLKCDDETFAGMLGKPIPPSQPVRPFHLNSTLDEISEVWLGRKVRRRVAAGFMRNVGAGQLNDPTLEKMFDTMTRQMPLRALALFSGGRLKFRYLYVLVALLNHQYGRALRLLFGSASLEEKLWFSAR